MPGTADDWAALCKGLVTANEQAVRWGVTDTANK